MRRFGPIIGLMVIILAGGRAGAQKVHNTYGSPLDTIRDTHLTTDVPAAKDFVRETSPDKKDLAYTPLTGVDPERPKPRDPIGVLALDAQLQSAGARNADRARGVTTRKAASPRGSRRDHAAKR